MQVVVGTDGVYGGAWPRRRASVTVVMDRRRRPVVGQVVRLVLVAVMTVVRLALLVMTAMQAVRYVAGRSRRRRVAEEVMEQPQQPVHR